MGLRLMLYNDHSSALRLLQGRQSGVGEKSQSEQSKEETIKDDHGSPSFRCKALFVFRVHRRPLCLRIASSLLTSLDLNSISRAHEMADVTLPGGKVHL